MGVNYSTDGGLTWQPANAGITNIRIVGPAVLLTSGKLFVINVFGMPFRTTEPVIVTSVADQTDLYLDFKIAPNPAVNDVKISGFSGKEMDLNISIIDIAGNIIKNFNDSISRGNFVISLDATELAPGAYLCIIENGKTKIIRKLLINH